MLTDWLGSPPYGTPIKKDRSVCHTFYRLQVCLLLVRVFSLRGSTAEAFAVPRVLRVAVDDLRIVWTKGMGPGT